MCCDGGDDGDDDDVPPHLPRRIDLLSEEAAAFELRLHLVPRTRHLGSLLVIMNKNMVSLDW